MLFLTAGADSSPQIDEVQAGSLLTEKTGKWITCSVISELSIEGAVDFISGWDVAANEHGCNAMVSSTPQSKKEQDNPAAQVHPYLLHQ